MQVDRARLRADLEANGEFGRVDVDEGWGRTVLTGSEADRRAREYFVERLEAAGCEVRIDPVGNVAGRWTGPDADPEAAPVAVGSHLDSVPRGGIFDGPLGVYGGLEALRAIQESDRAVERPIDVVAWTEEEGGRFDTGLLGSSAAVGARSVEETLALQTGDGTTLREYLERIGFNGDDRIDPASWDCWFELHVEQGHRLEEAGVPIGVVTDITGITNCEVAIRGESNHAGTTPMDRRTDALVAASEVIVDLESAATEVTLTDSDSAVGTVGKIEVEPNARNVVSGEVSLWLDIRDVEADSMDELVDRAEKSLARLERERGVETDLDRYRTQQPVPMSERGREAVHAGAARAGIGAMDLHSGGGHDTMKVAEVTDTVLLFAPSRDGVSHNPREWTDWGDCAEATRVMAEGMVELATE